MRTFSDLAEPFRFEGNELFVTSTVGVALFPDDGEEIETLLRHARMCNSKQSGQNAYSFYSRSLNEDHSENLKIDK